MTFKEATLRLKEASLAFCKPGTERVEALCALLGHPERAFRVIHVTGTNGKGSTSRMLASVLEAAGYQTGQFSSPYLSLPTECVCIGSTAIGKRAFARIAEKVFSAADKMSDAPTEFELLTVIAFLAFKEAKIDLAVIEVCMGGRLDATNVIDTPLLSVITGVSIDHTAFLGNTLAEIATVKAGIIKAGCPVLYGGKEGDAEDVIRAEADALHAPLHKTRYDLLTVESLSPDGTRFSFGDITSLALPLLGTYQLQNAATALTALSILKERLPLLTEEAIRRGFSTLTWAGRFERLKNDPPLFFDGGHNPEGISAAKESIDLYFKDGIILISGVLRDKDYNAIAATLAPLVRAAFTVAPKSARALDAQSYAAAFRRAGVDAIPCKNVKTALQKAEEQAKKHALPVVCLGSLYLYDAVKKALQKK